MRIWDVPVQVLCRKHLLGEHRELHAIWTYLTTNKGGSYRKHPETLRWIGKKLALYIRHEQQVIEMAQRGYNHQSMLELDDSILSTQMRQDQFLLNDKEQYNLLSEKCQDCKNTIRHLQRS